ncbi:MAG: dihydropteroate synthase [Candidatus Microbacterium phytovorans]|uniref:Dihydropteroate synthase n=1 Tax=Candidatus Microbacterium phytovorans TaxID=3121374 RepID=A0AAJ5VZQ7_9MICO|nr:dihydropteroate synthase [Microbacterium sp.]WEK13406.1 MAG: dihydropteroate synthase [Microbacterium sp.]
MTLLMGIVNVTPDSFSDGGRYVGVDDAIAHGRALAAAGADILDIGGESTRPGAERVPPEVELARVLPVIEALAADGTMISIDTMNAATAAAAIGAGALIVNDVSGGQSDPEIIEVVADSEVHFAIGHWRGPSDRMYARAHYDDVVDEVIAELEERRHEALAAGIPPARLILDPGFGFGKRGDQNWELLRGLERVVAMESRVLVGTSRKGFLAATLEEHGEPTQERRDLATAVTSVRAAVAGAWAVRVHDVAATRDALAVWERAMTGKGRS